MHGNNCCEKVLDAVLHTFNFLKLIVMFGVICYFWVWTCENRIIGMDVLEQLCKHYELDITFHENKMIRVASFTAKEDIDEKVKAT